MEEPRPEQRLDAKAVLGPQPPRDFFALLSSAEAALVLQCLDTTSRLAVAATCRRILSDALQPLAWKHAEPLRITDEQLLSQQYRQHAAHSLLQLAPVHLLLRSGEDVTLSMLQVGCIRRLHELEQPTSRLVDVSPLLRHPVARQLRQLKLSCRAGTASIRNLEPLGDGALAQLTSLHLFCGHSGGGGWNGTSVQQLSAALIEALQLLARPQLTELALQGLDVEGGHTHILQSLLRSSGSLLRLHLHCGFVCNAPASTAVVEQFAALGTALPRLQVLSLAEFRLTQHIPAECLQRLLSSLPALQTLQLLFCRLGDVLPHVPTCQPHLRHLLHFRRRRVLPFHGASEAAVRILREAMPQLRITEGAWAELVERGESSDWNVHTEQMVILEPSDKV